jgi:hypothetical protein
LFEGRIVLNIVMPDNGMHDTGLHVAVVLVCKSATVGASQATRKLATRVSHALEQAWVYYVIH